MVRQKDIAKKLNISRTTVARALNEDKNIKKETKDKILNLAKEMGYEKNYLSSSLASKKKKKIYAFNVKSLNIYYTERIKKGLKAIEAEMKNYNYKIKIIETDINEAEKQIEALKKIIRENNPDGIIITPLLKKEIKEVIQSNPKIKFVTLDIDIGDKIYHVGPNYFKSGEIAGDMMINMVGPKSKILLLTSPDDKISSELYFNGFYRRIKKSDLEVIGPVFQEDLLKNLDLVIKKYYSKDLKAIYSCRYITEVAEYLYNNNYKGLKIVGNGMNSRMKKLINKQFINATVREKCYEEGYLAGKLMFEMIYKEKSPEKRRYITKSEIIIKENL